MPKYNTLVRDRIPDIISQSGKTLQTRILEEDEFKLELQKKMNEELIEYMVAETEEEALDELAEMLELLYALVRTHGISFDRLNELRATKAEKQGEYYKKIMLLSVDDE